MSNTSRDSGLTYEMTITVMEQDIDQLNHVNNLVYLQWVQEVAGNHWRQNASESERSDYRWVVLRHEIDYIRPAYLHDEIIAKTWVEKMEGVKSHRHVEIIRDGQTLVKAITTWVMIDANTGRICRIPEEMAAKFLPAK